MKEILLDVSDLEAPMPLLRAKETVEGLEKDSFIHMIHRLSPCLLLPYLDKKGFRYKEIERDGLYHIFIAHADCGEEFLDDIARA